MIVALILGALICFALPLGSYIYIRKKSPKLTAALIAGFVTFYIFQLVLRVPLVQAILPNYEWFTNMNLFETALFLGLTAALVETFGRFVVLKFLLKEKQSYYTGIAHGIGHGGIEAILLLGINYIAYVVFSTMITNGTFDNLLIGQEQVAIAQLEYIKEFLTSSNILLIMVAILERVMVFIIQVGLSLLVMEGIINKKNKLILLTFSIHMTLDFLAVFLIGKGVSIYIVEGIILLFSVASIYYIITSKKRFKNNLIVEEEIDKYIKSDY